MKQKTNTWDTIADLYDSNQGDVGDALHRHMIDPATSHMLGDITEKTILDAGCGNGYWVRRLSKDAKHVIGIDNSVPLIQKSLSYQNPPHVEYHQADLHKPLRFNDNQFDVILSNMVFHYLSSITGTISEFYRVLKPKGHAIIVLQHPIFQYHFRIASKLTGYAGPFSQPVGYFDQKTVKQQILSGLSEVQIYNRPLSYYIQAFLHNNFVLTAFGEPEYSDELLTKEPRYQNLSEIPRVAILKFEKVK